MEKLNLWEKYGKRRIYLNPKADIKVWIEPKISNDYLCTFNSTGINSQYDDMAMEECLDNFSLIVPKWFTISFDDVIFILKEKGML